MVRIPLDLFRRDPQKCLKQAGSGEIIVLVEAGRDVAEVRPIPSGKNGRRPSGLCKGEFTVSDDFDTPLSDDILSDFEGT